MKSPSLPAELKNTQTVAQMTSDAVILLGFHRNLRSEFDMQNTDSTKEDWCLIPVYNLLIFILEEGFEDLSLVTKTQVMKTALATEVFYVKVAC